MKTYDAIVPNVGHVVGWLSFPDAEYSVDGATAMTIDMSRGSACIWHRNIKDCESPADVMAFLVGAACGYGCTLHNLDFM